MKYKIDNITYEVVIERKNNKNTYLRLKDNNVIYITTSYFVTKKQILNLIKENESFILRTSKKLEKKKEKEEQFYYLGKPYDIIIYPESDIEFVGNRLYVKNKIILDKWYKQEMRRVFQERLDYQYERFEEKIPYPILKIRTMKSRWGVCNKRDNSVTLNSELLKYDIEKIDYVIVHELSHFIYFDHSSDFWKQVSKYFPNYKRVRRELRN